MQEKEPNPGRKRPVPSTGAPEGPCQGRDKRDILHPLPNLGEGRRLPRGEGLLPRGEGLLRQVGRMRLYPRGLPIRSITVPCAGTSTE
jgi:hypothetical protein